MEKWWVVMVWYKSSFSKKKSLREKIMCSCIYLFTQKNVCKDAHVRDKCQKIGINNRSHYKWNFTDAEAIFISKREQSYWVWYVRGSKKTGKNGNSINQKLNW